MEGRAMGQKTAIVLVCLTFTGCTKTITQEQQGKVDYTPYVRPPSHVSTRIETEVTYSIINSNIMPGIKRSLDVRLNRKVSEETLRSIALELKAQDPRNYERTFICYYLPDMKVDAGAWATTHFNPNLEVRIQGLTSEEENALRKMPDNLSGEVIGNWLDDSLYVGGRVTIFRENGKLFLERKYKDGSSETKELVEKPSSRGRTFQKKEGSRFREFWLIDTQGNLQLWDEEGIITTARKID